MTPRPSKGYHPRAAPGKTSDVLPESSSMSTANDKSRSGPMYFEVNPRRSTITNRLTCGSSSKRTPHIWHTPATDVDFGLICKGEHSQSVTCGFDAVDFLDVHELAAARAHERP